MNVWMVQALVWVCVRLLAWCVPFVFCIHSISERECCDCFGMMSAVKRATLSNMSKNDTGRTWNRAFWLVERSRSRFHCDRHYLNGDNDPNQLSSALGPILLNEEGGREEVESVAHTRNFGRKKKKKNRKHKKLRKKKKQAQEWRILLPSRWLPFDTPVRYHPHHPHHVIIYTILVITSVRSSYDGSSLDYCRYQQSSSFSSSSSSTMAE